MDRHAHEAIDARDQRPSNVSAEAARSDEVMSGQGRPAVLKRQPASQIARRREEKR